MNCQLTYRRSLGLLAPICLVLAHILSCGGATVKVSTTPTGAEVTTVDGKKLGQTPIILTGDPLRQAAPDGSLIVLLSSPGYVQRELLLNVSANDSHDVKLTPMDENYFSKRIMNEYLSQSNFLVRELLRIRELIVDKRLDEAKVSLEKFQKLFPNIAFGYVMHANIALLMGDIPKARTLLLTAQSIDPEDPTIGRMLNGPARAPNASTPARTSHGKGKKQ